MLAKIIHNHIRKFLLVFVVYMTDFIVYCFKCITNVITVVVQRQAEGVVMRAQGKPHAHGNYKTGRSRE